MPLTQPRRRSTPSGFSLIELMIVVCIIGLVASMAIPAYEMLIKRVKLSERNMMMEILAKGMKDYIETHDRFPVALGAGASHCNSGYNPPLPASGVKKPWLPGQPILKDLPGIPDGPVYFNYRTQGTQVPGVITTFTIEALGDLDSDGATITTTYTFVLDESSGTWQETQVIPRIGDD